jgi:hypothetical protein
MSNLRRLKRVNKVPKKRPSILIVRPHKIEGQTCQDTSLFILHNHMAGIADSIHLASKAPELARNKAIHVFLHGMKFQHCTHIFFLDDDSPPVPVDAIMRLYRHDKPFIAAMTPIVRYRESYDPGSKKNTKSAIDCHWNAVIKKDGVLHNIGIDEKPKELFKAHRVGGTGLLIRREVFEKIKPPYQKTIYNASYTDVKISEDMYFTDKIREAGYDLWVDPNVECDHFHIVSLRDVFAIAIQAKKMGYEQAKRELRSAV